MSEHSKWSASGFEQKMLCPGSHVLQQGLPNTTSTYAAEGTAAHLVLTWALQQKLPASAFIGRVIPVDEFSFTVDDEMAGHVQTTIDYVHDVAGERGVVLVDRRVNYSRYLGVPEADAWGTLDVAVLLDDEIIAIDLKYGRGVDVSAGEDGKPNPQLALYALGALQEFQEFADFERVRLVISKPRVNSRPHEFDMTVTDLEDWAQNEARSTVYVCGHLEDIAAVGGDMFSQLNPGEKQCRFCKAKATCPKLRDDVLETILTHAPASPDEFADVVIPGAEHIEPTSGDWLSVSLKKVDLIEIWCTAVRAEVERRLLAGQEVPDWKLVQGKKGNRQWSDPVAAETLLKETFRLPVEKAYDLKLISPTSAEKLMKAGDIGPRRWPKVQALITNKEGKPHVAPSSDPRPALATAADDFEDVSQFA